MRVLIVDDDPKLRRSLQGLLADAGYEVVAEGDAERALDRARREEPDIVLCDVALPAMDGVTFLQRYREGSGDGLIIMLSPAEQAEAAIAAMREGAYGYIPKPVRPEEVALTLRLAEERKRLRGEVESLRASLGTQALRHTLVAESTAMRNALDYARTVAANDTPILITGEQGTGKRALARAIHELSPRRHGNLIGLNCAAVPEHVLQAEFPGSSSGDGPSPLRLLQQASGGTLVLEEIGFLPQPLHPAVLELVETSAPPHDDDQARGTSTRVIATSSRPLDAAKDGGEDRGTLVERLQTIHIAIPPLRERPDDIPSLITHFAQRAAGRLGRPISITPAALSVLSTYPWPGNVRELKAEIERAATLSETGRLDQRDFALTGPADPGGPNGGIAGLSPQTLKLKPQLESLERSAIRRALAASSGNRREAAQLLGVSLRTLFYKLSRYGLQ